MADGLSLPRPKARLLYKGVDIWGAISSEVVSLAYSDNLEGQADEIDLQLRNDHKKWFEEWFPGTGDELQGFLGYEGARLLDMGTFFLDEPCARGARSGDVFTIKGQSKPVDQSLKTQKTQAFENQSLKQIAQKKLSEAGLNLVGEPPEVLFSRVSQRREFDLEFLARLASDYGCFFAVKGKNALFAARDELFAQEPARLLRYGDRTIVNYSLNHSTDKTYSKAQASYFDGNKKKNIEIEIEDRHIKTGDRLKIDDRVEDSAQARKLTQSKLQQANMKAWKGTFEIVGDPACQAGQVVRLEGFGRWDRTYIIERARHRLSRNAYTTNLELADARPSQQ